MYLSHCPQLKLRHAISLSKLGFITRTSLSSSKFSAISRNSKGFRKPELSIARCNGKANDGEQRVARGGAWSALCKPMLFLNLEELAKRFSPMERKLWGTAIVCMLAGIAWFRNLAVAGLVDDTEPLFAEAARQM